MLKVYGYSDDNLVIEGAPYPWDEISCFDETVTVWFTGGTVIEAGYGKSGAGIWWIKVVKDGISNFTLTTCNDEDAEIYSDVLEIDAEVENVCVGPVNEDVQKLKVIFRNLKKEYPIQNIEKAYREVMDE